MAEDLPDQRRGNIGDHSEFLAFATIIADGYLELTDPTGEIVRGRLDVLEVSREAVGQREKLPKGKFGALLRKAYYTDGDSVMVKADADGAVRRLCSRSEVASNVLALRGELVSWSKKGTTRERSEQATGDTSAAHDLYSESANKLIRLLGVDGLKAPASSKSDLYLTFKQPNGTRVTQGFSVKSLMGSDSCLINHSGATLVTFEIVNCSVERALQLESEYLRDVVEPARVTKRKPGKGPKIGPATIIPALARAEGVEVKFSSIPHEVFRENLMGIDTRFPEMLAHVLYQRFLTEKRTPAEIVHLPSSALMMERIGYARASSEKTLESKVKDLFKKYAQGMNSAESWDGSTEVKGGWVLVIKDGKVTGYCFEDDDSFRKYLFENTYFDTPDVKRVPKEKKEIGAYVGRPYSVGGGTYLDLSLIVKFSKKRVEEGDKGESDFVE